MHSRSSEDLLSYGSNSLRTTDRILVSKSYQSRDVGAGLSVISSSSIFITTTCSNFKMDVPDLQTEISPAEMIAEQKEKISKQRQEFKNLVSDMEK